MKIALTEPFFLEGTIEVFHIAVIFGGSGSGEEMI
jgi:hypothetical protein